MSDSVSATSLLDNLVSEAEVLYPADGEQYAGPLALSAKNGDIPARIMLIGEAPGLKGAGSTGIPFFTYKNEQSANRFAKLMLRLGADCDFERGWRGHRIFVTDVVLRNPVERGRNGSLRNRGLTRSEVRGSLKLLEKQIDLVRPELLVGIGKRACQALSELLEIPITIDGLLHDLPRDQLKVVGCPHPSPHNNARADLLAIQEKVFQQLADYLRS